jgi:hypothetical protein
VSVIRPCPWFSEHSGYRGNSHSAGPTLVTIAAAVGAATLSFRYIVDRVPGLKDWLYSLWVKD